jgi:hypothetical protein
MRGKGMTAANADGSGGGKKRPAAASAYARQPSIEAM